MLQNSATLVAYRTFSDLFGKAAFFFITVVAARHLSAEAFGLFAIGSTMGWLAAVAADCGMQMHLARSVARAPDQARRLLREWLRLRLRTSGVLLAALTLFLVWSRGAGGDAAALVLFLAAYLTSGIVEFVNYFYRGLSRSDIESTLTLVQRGTLLVAATLVLRWTPDVTALAATLFVSGLATLAVSLRWACRLTSPRHGDAGAGTTRPQPANEVASSGRVFWAEVAPIGVGVLLSALYFRIDVFLVERWTGTDAAGLYNAVFRLVDALRLVPAAALAVMLPLLCRAASFRPLVRLAGVLTLFAAGLSAMLWPLADELVRLVYGPAYSDAVPAFRVLLAAFPLMSLNYALTHQLIGWDGHRAFAALCGAALVVNIGLNVRLIPAFGIVGAAWTTLWTEVVLTLGCLTALGLLPSRASAAAAVARVAS